MMYVFWISIIGILYVYFAYTFLLKIFLPFINVKDKNSEDRTAIVPCVSVIVAAYNEQEVIGERVKNLLKLDYPKEKLEIIIASDGSTDKTVAEASLFENVKILDFKENRGRSAVHNDAAEAASGEILIFTDACTKFDKDFLKHIIKDFENPKVGCVSGRIIFADIDQPIAESENLYWRWEITLRKLETKIGIFASGTGACICVRKTLFKTLDLREDIDDSMPLYVAMDSYSVVFEDKALAYDIPNASVDNEIKARIRMTAKGVIGYIKRWGVKGVALHPVISWSVISHKLMRWLTPFFMLGAFWGNLSVVNEGIFYYAVFVGQSAFYIAASIGFFGELFKKSIPIASTIFSFCVANLGMGIGVIKGITGNVPTAYQTLE